MLRVAAAVDLAELLEDQLLVVAADADAAIDHLEDRRGRRGRIRRASGAARAAVTTVSVGENFTAFESRL